MAAVRNVLVVGGGIAGMTLGTALTHAGIRAEIVEINPAWSVLGIGISVQGATLRALKSIGVLDKCVGSGFPYSTLIACDVNGKVTGTVSLPPLLGDGYPECVGMMRNVLQDILREAMMQSGVPWRLGVTVESLEQHQDRVDVSFTDGTHGSYDLVVGADGLYSKIRETVFGTGEGPQDCGQAVWRAMVHRPPEVKARYMFYGPRSKAGFNPVSQSEMYVFLVQTGHPRIADEELAPLMREKLSDFGGLVAEIRDDIQKPERIAYRPLSSMLLPPPWHKGRVVLVGDAAHSPTPQMASGAGMAVEDTIVLSELLQSETHLGAALEKFMARRYARCKLVVEASRQMSEWEKNPSAPDADPVGVLAKANAALAAPI